MRLSDRPIATSSVQPDIRFAEVRSPDVRSEKQQRSAPAASQGQRASDRYARAATEPEALRREELAGPLGAVAKAARLVTKVFGFRLGKFGLTYRTQDVAVDMEAVARDLAERARREAGARGRLFGEELDAARVLTLTDQTLESGESFETAEAPAADPAVTATKSGNPPQSWLIRLAFALYGRNAEPSPAGAGQPERSRLLAVA